MFEVSPAFLPPNICLGCHANPAGTLVHGCLPGLKPWGKEGSGDKRANEVFAPYSPCVQLYMYKKIEHGVDINIYIYKHTQDLSANNNR